MVKNSIRWVAAATVALAVSGCGTLSWFKKNKGGEDGPSMRWDRNVPYAAVETNKPPSADARETEVDRLARAAQSGSSSAPAYRLRVGDVVSISIRAPQPEQFEMVIDENSCIKLPFIDTVQAAGLTTSELESRIKRTYIDKKIYRMVTVNVFVPMRSYFVQGEVRAPGRFPLATGMTLLQAIATAGGFSDFADRSDVRILRGDKRMRFNTKEMESHPEKDVPVETGDVIIVTRSFI
jgi:polysaccharide export outer membrane protein